MSEYLADFRAGDTKIIKIQYEAGVDITGWVFYLALFEDFGKTNTVLVSTTAGANPLDDPANGLVYIVLDSDVSAEIPADKYYFTVKRSDPSVSPPEVKTIMPPIADYKDKVVVTPGSLNT